MIGALKRLFGQTEKPPVQIETGLSALEWLQSENDAALELTDVGALSTPEGKVALIDPLALHQPDWVGTPKENGKVIVFHNPEHGRNAILAIVFSDAEVTGGDDVGTCLVDAGMGSVFTPTTFAAQTAFADSLGDDQNLYDDYFDRFDDKAGGERKMANLPDGTPIPYVHAGWGDGAYPVFSLRDADGAVVAVYTDFMGKNDNGDYLTPPGFVFPEA